MNLPFLKAKAFVKGIFSSSIPYNPILEDGDSSPYFGTYEGQKYGPFDTSCCWDFSAAELAETRLEMYQKKGLIPQTTIDWLMQNGFIDGDGDFYLSRRWVAIISGVQDAGNQTINFWNLAKEAGMIPNKSLSYNAAAAAKWLTQKDFNNDYFNPNAITAEMENLGIEFRKRFTINAESLGGGFLNDVSVNIQTYLKEGSLQISIPVPQDGSWNNTFVQFPHRIAMDHAVELYKFDPSDPYPFYIYDSYEPHLKRLSKDYWIGKLTRVSILPVTQFVPIPIPASPWVMFWKNVAAFITGNPLPYPTVPIG